MPCKKGRTKNEIYILYTRKGCQLLHLTFSAGPARLISGHSIILESGFLFKEKDKIDKQAVDIILPVLVHQRTHFRYAHCIIGLFGKQEIWPPLIMTLGLIADHTSAATKMYHTEAENVRRRGRESRGKNDPFGNFSDEQTHEPQKILTQPEEEMSKEKEMKEATRPKNDSGPVSFKFNAQAPEFLPRSHTTATQMPISGYFYPYFDYLGATAAGGSDWFCVGNQDHAAYLISNNPNLAAMPNCPTKNSDVLTDDLRKKIIKQVEYQFSDMSLLANESMSKHINKDPEGYVPISVIASTKKMRSLVIDNDSLAQALKSSSKLSLTEDGKKVKRKIPFTDKDREELQSRIVAVENLPEDHSHQNVQKIFSVVGRKHQVYDCVLTTAIVNSVKTIRICHPHESNSSGAKNDFFVTNKLHALVELETRKIAEKAAEKLNDERNWRKGLRVRLLLRCSPKSVLPRGRRSEFDIWDEEDSPRYESTVDTFKPNNSESVTESHAEDSSGASKKAWAAKGHGKGKGRGQINCSRGLLAPVKCASTPQREASAKHASKSPRTPDGTKGFTHKVPALKAITISIAQLLHTHMQMAKTLFSYFAIPLCLCLSSLHLVTSFPFASGQIDYNYNYNYYDRSCPRLGMISGGPYYPLSFGRRDGLTASEKAANEQLPSPIEPLENITAKFTSKGLDMKDVAVLSGAHTIGFAQCFTFKRRLFDFKGSGKPDPTLESSALTNLQGMCPNKDASNSNLAPLDYASTYRFDNAYYVNLVNGTGLLESDQALMGDPRTAALVTVYSSNSYLFSADFASSMTKLSNLGILTGSNGQIRKKCGSPWFNIKCFPRSTLRKLFTFTFMSKRVLISSPCGAGHRPSPGFEGDSDDLGCHGSHGSPKTGGGSDDLSGHGSYGSPPPALAEIGYDY
ncbi:LOW QUALITY PROTEIN: hypothetical protein NC652_023682 [Populus alba x Populus x berolinensis]|nr:LOW QUALITY PROTEIN: hypothetical protein NC652_023682 [Populus alba x Populus x berolinensis]